jgi:hypothetical protein
MAMRFRFENPARIIGGAVFVWALLVSPPGVRAQGAGGGAGGGGQAAVQPVQELQFGLLIPGAATRVSPDDVARRGELQVSGRGQYQIQFLLPAALVSAEGASIPVEFGPGDAGLVRGTAGSPQLFDPTLGAGVALTAGITEAQLFLGGTARPAADQAAGTYSATVTVLVARN